MDLNAAIAAANSLAVDAGATTIDVSGSIGLAGMALTAISLNSGVTLDLVGISNATLDGGGTQGGLVVSSGVVDISGLAIANMTAAGTDGSFGGGGGAGLGGGLFLGSAISLNPANVTLTDVTFSGDAAVGGAGAMGSGGGDGQGDGNGFGGGSGTAGQGGGGLGAGGDIFVQQGASLTVHGLSSFDAGTVTGGAGGNPGGAFGDGIFLQGAQAVTFAPTAGETILVAGAIADENGSGGSGGAGGVSVDGSASGTVLLSAANTFTGSTTIIGGTLALSGFGSISGSSGITDNGAFDLSQAGSGVSITNLSGAGQVSLGGTTLTLTAASGTFSGILDGMGGLALSGGSETLTGASTYAGDTTIANGSTLTLSGTGSIAQSGKVIDNGALVMAPTGPATYSGQITGTGSLILESGTVTLTVGGDYTGGTTLDGGTLVLGGSAVAGTGAITFAAPASLLLQTPVANGSTVSLADTVAGFGFGDTLDLVGLAYDATAAVVQAGTLLTVTTAAGTQQITLDSGTGPQIWSARLDSGTGTVLTVAKTVPSGGLLTDFTVSSGEQLVVLSGGVASGTVVNGGGSEIVSSGATEVLTSGSVQNGTLTVSSGGTLSVASGATLDGFQVASGAAVLVASGGVASNVVIGAGGTVTLASGGMAIGTTVNSGGTLIVAGGTTTTGTILANGGSIDLQAASNVAGGTATWSQATNQLTVNEGGQVTTLSLAGDYTGQIFSLAADGTGGTVVGTAPAAAPAITGVVVGQFTTSEAQVSLFSGVTIADGNNGGTETVTITQTGGGTLSGVGAAVAGVYTISGTAADVTAALQAANFTPEAGAPNTSNVTSFALADTSSATGMAINGGTITVTNTEPAVTPQGGGTMTTGFGVPALSSATLAAAQAVIDAVYATSASQTTVIVNTTTVSDAVSSPSTPTVLEVGGSAPVALGDVNLGTLNANVSAVLINNTGVTTLSNTSSSLNQRIVGGAGGIVLTDAGTSTQVVVGGGTNAVTLDATSTNATFTGDGTNTVIVGAMGGTTTIQGTGASVDSIQATGSGNVFYVASSGAATILQATSGNVTIVGAAGATQTVFGGDGTTILSDGAGGLKTITTQAFTGSLSARGVSGYAEGGLAGNNTLSGNAAGASTLVGGGSGDTLVAGGAGDQLVARAHGGTTVLDGSQANGGVSLWADVNGRDMSSGAVTMYGSKSVADNFYLSTSTVTGTTNGVTFEGSLVSLHTGSNGAVMNAGAGIVQNSINVGVFNNFAQFATVTDFVSGADKLVVGQGQGSFSIASSGDAFTVTTASGSVITVQGTIAATDIVRI